MDQIPTPPVDIESAIKQFENWRANKKSSRESIPEELWVTARDLARKYSINEISKTLHLNHGDLKEKVLGRKEKAVSHKRKQPAFIELPSEQFYTQSECIIEMEDKSGCRMKMCFRGNTNLDLLELGKAFWSKKR